MIALYGLKTCDTCRKAIAALRAAGHDVTVVDLRADGTTKAQIARWADATGWERLLNKNSTTWRALPEADQTDVTKAKALALMAAHPTLIKRPVIEADGAVQIGWSERARR
jgi:arsenate reductase